MMKRIQKLYKLKSLQWQLKSTWHTRRFNLPLFSLYRLCMVRCVLKENLEQKGEEASQYNHYHWCKNTDSTKHHALQGTTGIVDSISPSSCGRCKEESVHHQQLHGPSIQTMVYMSKTEGPVKYKFRIKDLCKDRYKLVEQLISPVSWNVMYTNYFNFKSILSIWPIFREFRLCSYAKNLTASFLFLMPTYTRITLF